MFPFWPELNSILFCYIPYMLNEIQNRNDTFAMFLSVFRLYLYYIFLLYLLCPMIIFVVLFCFHLCEYFWYTKWQNRKVKMRMKMKICEQYLKCWYEEFLVMKWGRCSELFIYFELLHMPLLFTFKITRNRQMSQKAIKIGYFACIYPWICLYGTIVHFLSIIMIWVKNVILIYWVGEGNNNQQNEMNQEKDIYWKGIRHSIAPNWIWFAFPTKKKKQNACKNWTMAIFKFEWLILHFGKWRG